jgi:hypothetical protein
VVFFIISIFWSIAPQHSLHHRPRFSTLKGNLHMTQSLLPSPLPSYQPISGIPTLKTLLCLPLLYGMCFPLFFLDIGLSLYHWTVFPFLGIKRVERKQYIRIDRHRLSYLPWVLKLGCAYCGYANGLLHYAMRIAGDTELYFCPRKHQETPEFHAPPHHQHFAEYGDAEGFSMRFHGHHDSD